jgi:hypothetical protein
MIRLLIVCLLLTPTLWAQIPIGATADIPDFFTFDPTTGISTAADAAGPPYCLVRRNQSDTPLAVSGAAIAMVGITSSNGYRMSFAVTVANGFAIDDNVNVDCWATVGGLNQPVHKYNFRVTASAHNTISKNVASQQLGIVFKSSAGSNVTGLATGSIACTISKDFGAPATTNDTTEAEVGNGLYYIDLTQAETNANWIYVNCSGTGALDYSALITTQH